MWKTFLAFIGHRILLCLTIYLVLMSSRIPLFSAIARKVADLPEYGALSGITSVSPTQIFSATRDPYLWINWLAVKFIHVSPVISLLFFSSFFFCLFLWELHTLLNRMVTPDVSDAAVILAVLWPTSYEMSLGSGYALCCLFAIMTIRHALDNHWLFAGLALAGLALLDVSAVAAIPLLVYIFWYFQRHFQFLQILKRTAYFLVPVSAVMLWRYNAFSHASREIDGSALMNLLAIIKGSQPLASILTPANLGQTAAILFLSIGAALAALGNAMLVHKLIPVNLLVMLLAFAPYGSIASRALFAGAALQGIATHSSRSILGFLQILFLCLGIYEVFTVFS